VASREPRVVLTAGGSAAALAGIVSMPGVSQAFGCTPLDPAAWAIVVGCAAAATAAAVLAPRLDPSLEPFLARVESWAGLSQPPDGQDADVAAEREAVLAEAR
jgi:hypothetical protein